MHTKLIMDGEESQYGWLRGNEKGQFCGKCKSQISQVLEQYRNKTTLPRTGSATTEKISMEEILVLLLFFFVGVKYNGREDLLKLHYYTNLFPQL